MDGVACAVLAYVAYEGQVEITYCDYHDVDEKITTFIESGNAHKYDRILITDISVNDATAELIQSRIGSTMLLLDHHASAERLNRYVWAVVMTDDAEGHKTSGTSLLYAYLLYERKIDPSNADLSKLAETVRRYDSWEWTTFYHDVHPKLLNDLFWLIGARAFFARFIVNQNVAFSDSERRLLDVEHRRIAEYIEKKANQMSFSIIQGKKVGIVFAEQYQSELGNELAKSNPELDLIAMIDPSKSVSYRTIKGDIDLSVFAQYFGGGGHKASAGSPISNDLRSNLQQLIFSWAETQARREG
jgi:oligoribonuclease NrnB/cAMP/cGMP phosphodiesterase (DHH superfamily)